MENGNPVERDGNPTPGECDHQCYLHCSHTVFLSTFVGFAIFV